MENKSHAFMAGLFALFLGLATLAALYWFGGRHEEMRDYLVVTRRNVTGLNPQAQVRYRGIRVGKVNDIRLDPQDARNILIAIQIGREVPITRGTVAKLAYQGVTGLGHILLEDGGKDPTPLPAGEGGEPPRIPMAPSLLDELGDSGKDVLKQAKEVLGSARDALDEENRRKFAAILSNLEKSTGQMQPTLENLNATLVQARRLLDQQNIDRLSRAAGEAGPLLAETRGLVASLRSATDKLDAAIEPAAGGAAALMPRLNDMAGDISASSRQLNRVLKMIEDSPRSLVFGAPAAAPGPGEPGFVPPPIAPGESNAGEKP